MQSIDTASPIEAVMPDCNSITHECRPTKLLPVFREKTFRLQALLQIFLTSALQGRCFLKTVSPFFPCAYLKKHGQYFSEDEKSRLHILGSLFISFLLRRPSIVKYPN